MHRTFSTGLSAITCKMFRILMVAALLVSVAVATPVHQCSGKPSPIEVRVEGCTALPCTFEQGSTVHAEVDFTAPHGVEHMRPDVTATVFGVEVAYKLKEQNACNSLINSACPLEQGDIATYLLDMPIGPEIPKIQNLNVRLDLVDTDANDVVDCFSVELSVV